MNQNEGDHSKVIKPEPNQQNHNPHSSDYAPYPKIDPNDVSLVEPWSSVSMASQPSPSGESTVIPLVYSVPKSGSSEHATPNVGNSSATTMFAESNPYVSPSPMSSSSSKNKVDSMKDMLGKFGKKAAGVSKKVEGFAGDMWQHLKTSPSFADAAVGRITHGTKVLAEGGYEKIFRQTFETVPEEQLQKSYACYLSTAAGPVMGVLYLSTAKLSFCSDNPLSYKVGEETQWSYYKVVIPLHLLKAVNHSTSKVKPSEKYIQVISVDNHEFWFMGFVNYDSAVKNLQGIVQPPPSS